VFGLWLWSLAALAATPVGARIEIRDGAALLASFTPRTKLARRGTPIVREIAVGAHRVIEVRLGDKERQEVWLGERRGATATPLWTGLVGSLDEDGETTRSLVLGDELAIFESAARISRCDGAPVRLFARAWDFARGRFQAVSPTPPAPAAATLTARRQAGGRAARGGFSFTAASSAAGATDVEGLRPPAALNDGDPATAWAASAGAFATARSGSDGLAVTGVRLNPARGKPAPRRLTLVLGPAEGQRFDVAIPAGGGPVWMPLPAPVPSACVTVLVPEAAAIGDLEVVTDLDGGDGVVRLVQATREGGSCEGRVPLLVAAGAVGPVAKAIGAGPAPGRECLLDALVQLLAVRPSADPVVGQALVAALAGASAAEEKLALSALARQPAPPLAALRALLEDPRRGDEDRQRAARALGAVAGNQVLLGAVGAGSPALRAAVREALAAHPPALAEVQRALAGAPSARRADLMLVLSGPGANALLRAAAEGDEDFAVRARAIEGLGRLGDAAALGALRARGADPVLRFLATRELAALSGALPALRAALGDGDPRVRETAALAVGSQKDAEAAPALVAAAKREPWPFARRAQVSALGLLCTPAGNDLMARAVERDVAPVRRAALEGLARCRDGRAAGLLLERLESEGEEPENRTVAARLVGTLGDRAAAARLGRVLDRLREEAQVEPALEGVAVAALQSLARLGGPDAVTAALAQARAGAPGVRRAALEALGTMCAPEGKAGIDAGTRDPDPTVAAAARAARRQCGAAP
jgi:HEAT repeat protein